MAKDPGAMAFHRFYKGQGHIDERGKKAAATSKTAKRMGAIARGRGKYSAKYTYKPGYVRSLTKVKKGLA
jgi:hypothetical protein